MMETDPMNNAKAALPSPIALVNANHPTNIVNTAMPGPIHLEVTLGSCGITGFVRRQSEGVPRSVLMRV
jgi:hypothetical protein